MTVEQIEKGNELQELITKTESQLKGLYGLKEKRNPKDKRHFNDGQFFLSISEYYDGSGAKAELNRYYGNAELLDVIIETLEKQVAQFKKLFKEL